jgi:GNAT superfamily N-acetyltransferase
VRTRRLRRKDLDAAAAITLACNRDHTSWAPASWVPPGGGWEDERPSWARLLDDPGTWGRVAIDDTGWCVGVVAVDRADEVRRLFVDPGHQGRGIGGQLLDLGEAEVRRRGRPAAELWTPEGSRAVGFYERRGWRPDGRTRFHERLRLPLIGMTRKQGPTRARHASDR